LGKDKDRYSKARSIITYSQQLQQYLCKVIDIACLVLAALSLLGIEIEMSITQPHIAYAVGQ
jgi:hypothetical protein